MLDELGYAGLSLEEALPAPGVVGPIRAARSRLHLTTGFAIFTRRLGRHCIAMVSPPPCICRPLFISSRRQSFHDRECLTWEEVRELRKQGIRLARTRVNPSEALRIAVAGNRARSGDIQSAGGAGAGRSHQRFLPIRTLSRREDRGFTRRFTELVRASGYRNFVTTVIGRVRPDEERFCLKRLPVNDCDDAAL